MATATRADQSPVAAYGPTFATISASPPRAAATIALAKYRHTDGQQNAGRPEHPGRTSFLEFHGDGDTQRVSANCRRVGSMRRIAADNFRDTGLVHRLLATALRTDSASRTSSASCTSEKSALDVDAVRIEMTDHPAVGDDRDSVGVRATSSRW